MMCASFYLQNSFDYKRLVTLFLVMRVMCAYKGLKLKR